MKRILTLLLAMLLLVSLLSACQKKEPAEESTTVTTELSYEPIPDVVSPTAETQKAREFQIAIETPETVPQIPEENDITPEEFENVLLVGNMSPFTNQFMECEPEDFERRDDVYALSFTNISDKTLDKLTVVYSNGEKELTFIVEMLPANWTVVAMDTEGTAVTETKLSYVSGQVEYLTEGKELTSEVELTETMDNTIIVKNMTDEEMKQVVVYYRDVDYQGNVLAGRCFRASTTMELIPGWQEELETDQWLDSCVIVNVILRDVAPE